MSVFTNEELRGGTLEPDRASLLRGYPEDNFTSAADAS